MFDPCGSEAERLFCLTPFGSLSTVVGDEKLTSREDLIGLLFFYVALCQL